MRTLDEHKVNPANDQLQVLVVDEPGAGGANHAYHVFDWDRGTQDGVWFNGTETNHRGRVNTLIKFQNGPIAEAGVNGLTHEVLLAIVADRLRSFQAGPYACSENAFALNYVEGALWWLKHRTEKRLARGVEGTRTV